MGLRLNGFQIFFIIGVYILQLLSSEISVVGYRDAESCLFSRRKNLCALLRDMTQAIRWNLYGTPQNFPTKGAYTRFSILRGGFDLLDIRSMGNANQWRKLRDIRVFLITRYRLQSIVSNFYNATCATRTPLNAMQFSSQKISPREITDCFYAKLRALYLLMCSLLYRNLIKQCEFYG